MRGSQPDYRSFLLRFWHEKCERNMSLRVIVVDTQTGERYGFDGFEGLVQFLKQRIDWQETQKTDQEVTIDDNE